MPTLVEAARYINQTLLEPTQQKSDPKLDRWRQISAEDVIPSEPLRRRRSRMSEMLYMVDQTIINQGIVTYEQTGSGYLNPDHTRRTAMHLVNLALDTITVQVDPTVIEQLLEIIEKKYSVPVKFNTEIEYLSRWGLLELAKSLIRVLYLFDALEQLMKLEATDGSSYFAKTELFANLQRHLAHTLLHLEIIEQQAQPLKSQPAVIPRDPAELTRLSKQEITDLVMMSGAENIATILANLDLSDLE